MAPLAFRTGRLAHLRLAAACWLIGLLVAATAGLFPQPSIVHAQTATVVAERLDATYEIQPSGDVLVRETWRYTFNATQPIRQGFRTLPLGRVDGITNVGVSDGGQAYARLQPDDARRENAFRVTTNEDKGDLEIRWYFSPISGRQTRTWTISYRARGAILEYERGDQFWWRVVHNLDYPVQATTATVTLPVPAAADQLRLAANPEGQATRIQTTGDRTVVFDLAPIPQGRTAEIRVQFPHGAITGPPPQWQSGVDQQTWLEEQVRPTLNLFMLLLAFGLLPVLGLVGLLYLWWTQGRDPAVGAVPDVLTTPPSRLPPGMVGTLIDESADPQDVLATLADLGERGIIQSQEVPAEGLVGSDYDFELERRPLPPGVHLRPYEQTFLDTLFGDESTIRLSAVRGRFFPAIPRFAQQLENAVAAEGLTNGAPSAVRGRYRGLGITIIVISVVAGILSLIFVGWLTPLVVLPFITIGVLGFGLTLLSRSMPARTRAGALEAARWRAFRNYLARLPQETPAEAPLAASRYLPYAIALGLNRQWVDRLASVGVPAPPWFRPLGQPTGPWGPGHGPYAGPHGGPYWGPGPYGGGWGPFGGGGPVIIVPGGWGGGTHPQYPGPGGSVQAPPQPGEPGPSVNWPQSPQDWSDQAGGGFQDASDSLARMFDTASDLFSGHGGGGGGGWSGGGSGWGGGGDSGSSGGGFSSE